MGGFKRGIVAELGRGGGRCALGNEIPFYPEYRFNDYGDKDLLVIKIDLYEACSFSGALLALGQDSLFAK